MQVKAKEDSKAEKLKLEVSPEQAEQLESLFELAKALSSPTRLVLIGVLASRSGQVVTVAEVAEQARLTPNQIERDLRQLAEAGFILITQWYTSKPGHESVPQQVMFQPEFVKMMPPLISTLHQLKSQLQPTRPKTEQDERSRTLTQFMKAGRLTSFPAQLKRQVYVVEEIAKVFETGVRYSEREVDTILKDIYEYDHCTLRRYLVDLKFLQRADGFYWKAQEELSETQP